MWGIMRHVSFRTLNDRCFGQVMLERDAERKRAREQNPDVDPKPEL
jgi:hypothetical protein